jgi:hypothetical protein
MSSTFEDRFKLQAINSELLLLGESISYTPNGSSLKTITALILHDTYQTIHESGNSTQDYDVIEMQISSRNNTEGHVTPLLWGRDGTGDVIAWDSKTWYVRDILEKNVAGMHRLVLATVRQNIPQIG